MWTLGIFQMVTGESCQCIRHTKQTDPCHVGVRHDVCTVPKCGFVIRGLDHKELVGRLTAMQQVERGLQLGAAADDRMTLSHVWNTPDYDSTLLMQVPCM